MRASSEVSDQGSLGVTVFAPASVSNVACGFDALGFALEHLGDLVHARTRAGDASGVEISEIRGDSGLLPTKARSNTAGLAAQSVLDHWQARGPQASRNLRQVVVELEIEKCMPLSSGLGSSAASAVGGAVATDLVLQELTGDEGLSKNDLLLSALEGEKLASGSEHGDNLGPSLWGGFVLVRAIRPEPDFVQLPVPENLYCALVKPDIEVKTHEARGLIATQVPLADAIAHWANVGALVAALHSGDLALLGRALEDRIAEPCRAGLVPGFREAKQAAVDEGALGSNLSGSGTEHLRPHRGQGSRGASRRGHGDGARDRASVAL